MINEKEYVYLAYDGRYYKIGKSKDPVKRISTMKTANPLLNLVTFTDKLNEKTLHNLFRHKRVKGEYFKFDGNEIKNVIAVFNGSIGINHPWYIKMRGKSLKALKKKCDDNNYYNYKMMFGKYKDHKLISVPDQYLKWLYNQGGIDGKLKKYIFRKLNVKQNQS